MKATQEMKAGRLKLEFNRNADLIHSPRLIAHSILSPKINLVEKKENKKKWNKAMSLNLKGI